MLTLLSVLASSADTSSCKRTEGTLRGPRGAAMRRWGALRKDINSPPESLLTCPGTCCRQGAFRSRDAFALPLPLDQLLKSGRIALRAGDVWSTDSVGLPVCECCGHGLVSRILGNSYSPVFTKWEPTFAKWKRGHFL